MIHSSVWITKLFHFRCAKLFLFFVVEKYLTVATLTDNCRHSVARPRLTQTRNTLVVMIVTRLLPATSRPRRYKTQICNIRHIYRPALGGCCFFCWIKFPIVYEKTALNCKRMMFLFHLTTTFTLLLTLVQFSERKTVLLTSSIMWLSALILVVELSWRSVKSTLVPGKHQHLLCNIRSLTVDSPSRGLESSYRNNRGN